MNRAEAHNALRQIESAMSVALQKSANQIIDLLADDGAVTIGAVHAELFPHADTVTAAAQLSTLVKKLEAAAKGRGCPVSVAYTGSKKQDQ